MQKAPDGQYEMVLENRQVLTIFFVVVILCGVFFGLGYIVGSAASRGYMGPSEPANAAIGKKSAIAPDSGLAEKPSRAAAPAEAKQAETPAAAEAGAQQPAASEPAAAKAPPVPPEQATAKAPAPEPTAQTKPVPASTQSAPAPAAGAEGITLQVIALSKREDAEQWVTKLKDKGYPVKLATSGHDSLFHVQLGPFSSVSEATQMSAKLEREFGIKAIKK